MNVADQPLLAVLLAEIDIAAGDVERVLVRGPERHEPRIKTFGAGRKLDPFRVERFGRCRGGGMAHGPP